MQISVIINSTEYKLMRKFNFFCSFFILCAAVTCSYAQQGPSSYVLVDRVAEPKTVLAPPYTGSATTFTLHFGTLKSGGEAKYGTVTGFNMPTGVSAGQYRALPRANDAPYSRVVVNRVPTSAISNLQKFTGFFEVDVKEDPVQYYKAEYVDKLEEIINSYAINRGADNIFSATGNTANNVERVDLLVDGGIVVPGTVDVNKMGILMLERGGNDNFKLAYIKRLDVNGKVAELGPLTNVLASNWSPTGRSVTSVVFQNSSQGTDLVIKPDQNIGNQPISGTFVSFSSLQVPKGTTIYGVAVFPNDVTASMDLIGLTNVPLNTDGGNAGALDFMGGGGFFIESSIALPKIKGTVWQDVDGDAVWDSGETPFNAGGLWVNLINAQGLVGASAALPSNGAYEFEISEPGTYRVMLTAARQIVGEIPVQGNPLSILWDATGINVDGAAQSGNKTSIISNIIVNETDVINRNFGFRASQSDLAVVKTVNNAIPKEGEMIIFTVQVTNNGYTDATGVNVIDKLPSGYTFVSVDLSQGTYNTVTGDWNVGNLASGGSATLKMSAKALAVGAYENTATVSANQADPVSTNNKSTVSVEICKAGTGQVQLSATTLSN